MYPRERFVGTTVALVLGLAMVTGFLTVPPSVAAGLVEDAWIGGVVDDMDGPVAGVYVKVLLSTMGNLEMGYAFTDDEGRFTIGVPGGLDFTVIAANGSYYLGIAMVKVRSGETASVDITLDPIAPTEADILVRGWVKDSAGNPSSEGHVLGLSWPPSGGEVPHYANVTKPGTDGYFEVNIIESAAWGGVMALDFPGYSMVENRTETAVTSGEIHWLNITLSGNSELDTAMVHGYVTDQGTGLPLEGVLIIVEAENDETDEYTNTTFTDSDGYYEMEVMDGTADITFIKGGYSMGMYRELAIGPGDELRVDADLLVLDCVVKGYVTDLETDDPLPMAQVILTNWGFSDIAMATTDSSGYYELDGFNGSGLIMLAMKDGYSDDHALVDLLPGGEAWQDFGLWPLSAVLEGTVVDAISGDPVAGAGVHASSEVCDGYDETDGDGQYRIPLVPGSYRVRADTDGYLVREVEDVELVYEETTTLHISLLPSDHPLDTRVYGWVNDSESSEGIQDVEVRIGLPDVRTLSQEPCISWMTKTGESGYYELDVPSVEHLTYLATADDYGPYIDFIDVAWSDEYRMDVQLSPDETAPELVYVQDPVSNISWTNPSYVDITVVEENLRMMALHQYMFWYNAEGKDIYYLISGKSTSFDPFGPSNSLPYLQSDHTYYVDEELDGTVVGGWLEDGADSWYVAAYEYYWFSVPVYYVLEGYYSNGTLTYEPARALFNHGTGDLVSIEFYDRSKPAADGSDLSGLFNPWVSQLRTEEDDPSPHSWEYDHNVGLGNMSVPSLVYNADGLAPSGKHLILFLAADFGENWNWALQLITVDNEPPVADAGPDFDAVVDNEYTLNGTGSSDNVGIVSYEWDFEHDGADIHLTGAEATYVFTALGLYAVNLTVTDGAGHQDVDTVWVNVVTDAPPVADAGPDQTVDEGTEVQFDGSGSTDDLLVITNYTWTIVELEVEMYGEAPTYTFDTPGTYTVELVVTDLLDQESQPDSMTVTVLDVTAPVADAGPDPVGVMTWDTVTFDGSGSSDNVGIVSYTWTFDDDGLVTLTGVTAEYVFSSPGEYVVTLTVTDAAGLSDTDTVVVRVASSKVAPVADAGDDMTATVGKPVLFDGTGSSDDAVTFTWTFEYGGELVTLTGAQVEFVFDIAGTYIVTLNVTNEDGLWATDDVVVVVSEGGVSTFLKDYWWLLAAVAAIAVIAALLVLMKGGKGGATASEQESDEELEEEDLPPPDDEDL